MNVERLGADVNHEDNLIPLCNNCHEKFDKPRTREEYDELLEMKKGFLRLTAQKNSWRDYGLREELIKIIKSLSKDDIYNLNVIEFDPKDISQKLNSSMKSLTARNIRSYVSEYFVFVRDRFAELEIESPGSASVISLQVKTYYKSQISLTQNQQEVYKSIVRWVKQKTHSDSDEAAEIIVSFFIQNCEVFDAGAK